MQCYCGTDTISTVDIHELLRPDAWDESVSTGSFLLWIPSTQPTSYGNYRSAAIIESLHEITEVPQMWYFKKIFPRLHGSLSSCK